MKRVFVSLLVLCFISMANSLCFAQGAVTGINVRISRESPNPFKRHTYARETDPGFHLIDVDLNKGCGSDTDDIYMSYSKDPGQGAPITGITVVEGSTLPPLGYTKSGKDLNRGAGGAYLYVCYTRQPGAPITDLCVTLGDQKMPPGWHKIPLDLNKGAGGDYIYLWYKK